MAGAGGGRSTVLSGAIIPADTSQSLRGARGGAWASVGPLCVLATNKGKARRPSPHREKKIERTKPPTPPAHMRPTAPTASVPPGM